MSLVTRCPSCETAFRATPGQLAARAGRVRCGKCGSTFDGLASLVGPGPAAAAEPVRPAPPAVGPSAAPVAPLPPFMAEPRAPRRALWGALCAVALLALALQSTYHFRSEIAVSVPAARPALQAACRTLGCEVPLPRQLGLLSIDSYELHQDPRREGLIVLNAVIRNRAPFPQQYPSLQLTLTDAANQPVASRLLAPRDYLDAERAPQLLVRGLEAGGEAALTLYFDARRARASGYELVLFYPS